MGRNRKSRILAHSYDTAKKSTFQPNCIFQVRHRNLVHQQEEISKQLLEFSGLEWDLSYLDFLKTKRPVFTSMSQVGQPLYTSLIGRWKNYDQLWGPLKEPPVDYL